MVQHTGMQGGYEARRETRSMNSAWRKRNEWGSLKGLATTMTTANHCNYWSWVGLIGIQVLMEGKEKYNVSWQRPLAIDCYFHPVPTR